ncbi:2'-5' RNA ligase family protein [Oecophyllibacter saccharovorans]|uniref:2'-5' RNA ligase family protein n=1 Tax=Oecophyllibacter saccharovorans TaxID=2558360 RepID=A0A506UQA3_9PROT|nr:2'-5' RNA ligase family protein [Oecophyllibacter saccharovorans]TPW35496.1 hypothetical protein E3202_00465 [Oecophyllibacter saccharovorans]
MKLSLSLPLPPALAADLSLLRGTLPGVDWTPQQQLFLCLRPLGQITDGRLLEELDFGLSRLRWSPFSLSLKELLLLEAPARENRNDRLACAVAPQEPLLQLRQRIDRQFRQSILPQSRHRFRPHVTIGQLEPGRRAEAVGWIQKNNLFRSREFVVDRLHLLEHFQSGGAPGFTSLAAYGHDGSFHDTLKESRDSFFSEVPSGLDLD